MVTFRLAFDPRQIAALADRYWDSWSRRQCDLERSLENVIAPRARARGWYTRAEFCELAYWKSPRQKARVRSNTARDIREVTRSALSHENERVRIGGLIALGGVSWPTASACLHFGCADRYPILDFRALWSVGHEGSPSYGFDLWWSYTDYCRRLGRKHRVSMRVLDRALWQHSKENQPKA